MRLDDALLEEAKREAERLGISLTAFIERGLRLMLAQSSATSAGGVLPGVDLNDSASLLDIMEGHG